MVAPTLPPMMAAVVSAVLEDVSGGDAEGIVEFSYILTQKLMTLPVDICFRHLTKARGQAIVFMSPKSTPS